MINISFRSCPLNKRKGRKQKDVNVKDEEERWLTLVTSHGFDGRKQSVWPTW